MRGYAASRYLLYEGPANRGSEWPVTVTLEDPESYLNVRSGPGTNYDIIGKLSDGQIITEYLDRSLPIGWSLIRF
ncbi:SH3 domain-containing protein [Desulfoscipio sp. XC116]|uniref:SH3 domain-containing protein n=1 Tax=Desulfoscipio sp. XC116 TaxID=3144975 RepID=UPI00325AB325